MAEGSSTKPRALSEEEIIICRLYLEDLDKYKTCNEYKLLQGLLNGEFVVEHSSDTNH